MMMALQSISDPPPPGKPSPEIDGAARLTYLLRPDPSRINAASINIAQRDLDTPTASELDAASSRVLSSVIDSASDYAPSEATEFDLSDIDSVSDLGSLSNSIPDMRESLVLP